MTPAGIFSGFVGATLFLVAGTAMAADYRADEFFGLDLSKAVLSPKPLGPAAAFESIPVPAGSEVGKANGEVAKTERAGTDAARNDAARTDAMTTDVARRDEAAEAPRMRAGPKAGAHRDMQVARLRSEKPRGAARIKLAHRHGSPLEAQAFDTRIQTWPCKSGGICDWKR
jgi:hypothetical protein